MKVFKSFKYAFAGIGRLFKERNFRIHIFIAAMVACAGVLCKLSIMEWCLIILCYGMVLAAEGLNTALEILADRVCPSKDESIRLTKDVSAGAVLIAAIASAVVGVLIFANKIICLIA